MTTKAEKISIAVDYRQNNKWGALTIESGEYVMTYKKRLAWFDHANKICWLNPEKYSVTSTNHRERVREAARFSGFEVREVANERELGTFTENKWYY